MRPSLLHAPGLQPLLAPVLLAILLPGTPAQEPDSRPGEERAETRPARERALEANARGAEHYKGGRYQEAVTCFTRAHKLDPEDSVIARNLANALHGRSLGHIKAGRLEEARKDLERARALAPDQPVLAAAYGSLLVRMGRMEHARRVLEETLRSHPESAPCYEALGRLEYAREHLQKALELLETAARLDPEGAGRFQEFLEKVRREAGVEARYFTERRGPFAVKYDDREFRGVSLEVLDMLDRHYNALGRTLGHWPRRPVTVVLYGRKDYDLATGAHAWTGGLFDGKIRLPVRNFQAARERIDSTLAHELSHLFVRSLTSRCPLWLDEGLAQLRQGRRPASVRKRLRSTLQAGKLVRIDELPGSWTSIKDRERVALYYAEALSFTGYLRRRFGMGALVELLGSLDAEETFGAAFRRVMGMSLEEAEAAWRSGL